MADIRIARLRLLNQRIASRQLKTAGEVVRWMGAVQCQDLQAGQWAVALRTRRQTLADIERAIAQKKIVRTWPMRGTLHFVPASDARWMLRYLAQRTVNRSSARYKQLGLDGPTFSRGAQILERALEGGNRVGRFEAYKLLEQNGVSCEGQRGIHILGRLSQDGLLCFGPRTGTTTTFVLLEEWIPPAKIPPREEALARLALTYFASHGPATVNDFAWWSSLTLTEARRTLAEVKSKLEQVMFEGTTYWVMYHSTTSRNDRTQAYLLPAFDEFLVAYKDRGAAIDPAHARRMHPGGGILHPTVVLNEQVVATWGRTTKNDHVVLHVRPFRRLSSRDRRLVEESGRAYESFLGKDVIMHFNK